MQRNHARTHAHTAVLQPFVQDYSSGPVQEQTFTYSYLKTSGCMSSFWISRSMGKITEASVPTMRLDATPSGPSTPHIHHPPQFYAGCPSCRNPPNLSWLGTGTKYVGQHTWRLAEKLQFFIFFLHWWPSTIRIF